MNKNAGQEHSLPESREPGVAGSASPELYVAGYYASYAGTDALWLKNFRKRKPLYRNLIRKLRRARARITDVAEIGCGVGMFSCALLEALDVNVVAGDISKPALDIAGGKLQKFARARVVTLDAQAVALPSDSFDVVVSMDVIEHLPQPEAFLREAFRVLRNGGVLLFSTPNPQSLGCRIKSKQTADRDDPGTWFGLHDETHVNIRSMDAWREQCLACGFEKASDGSDFLWDIPYFKGISFFLQKLVFIGSAMVLWPLFGFMPWRLGENYYGIWRKP
jgi:SAM-dependent methyltransferase